MYHYMYIIVQSETLSVNVNECKPVRFKTLVGYELNKTTN